MWFYLILTEGGYHLKFEVSALPDPARVHEPKLNAARAGQGVGNETGRGLDLVTCYTVESILE